MYTSLSTSVGTTLTSIYTYSKASRQYDYPKMLEFHANWLDWEYQARGPPPPRRAGRAGRQGWGGVLSHSLHLIAKMMAFYSFALGGATSTFNIKLWNASLEKTAVRISDPLPQHNSTLPMFALSMCENSFLGPLIKTRQEFRLLLRAQG